MGQEDDMKKVLRPMREMLRQVRETTAVDTWQAIRRDVIAGLALGGMLGGALFTKTGKETLRDLHEDRAEYCVNAANALIAKLDETEKTPEDKG